MAALRTAIPDFVLANPIYAGAAVTFFTVSAGVKTSTAATLYDAATGTSTLSNPVTLDSDGKFVTIPYIEVDVIGAIDGVSVSDHDTGVIRPALDQDTVDEAQAAANTAQIFGGDAALKANKAAASATAAAASAASLTTDQIALIAESFS